MAQIIDIPAAAPAWQVIIDESGYKQSGYNIDLLPNDRHLITITARTWEEAEQLRDKARGTLRKTKWKGDPRTKAGAVISKPAEKVAERLKAARKAKGCSVEELAAACGTTAATIELY